MIPLATVSGPAANKRLDLLCITAVRTRVASMPSRFGWERYVVRRGRMLGLSDFGASAPLREFLKEFGFTVDHVVAATRAVLEVSGEELATLAPLLRQTLLALYTALGNPDFNYIIHTAPTEDETKDYYLWHIQILPRVTTIAGFELGSGIYITTMLPEESAAFLREFMPGRETGPR